MKRFFAIIFIVVVCVVGCGAFLACDAINDNNKPVTLYDGIRAEDLFKLLEQSFSYTINVNGEFYRFVKGKGYSILEDGVFDGLLAGDGIGYRYHKEPMEMVEQSEVPLDEAFYAEIDAMYDKYVALLKKSFAESPTGEPVEFKTDEKGDKVIVKVIVKKDDGSFSIISCEIRDINSTELIFPN